MNNTLKNNQKYLENKVEIISFIKESWKFILGSIFISVLVALGYIYIAPNVYEASIVIQNREIKSKYFKFFSFEEIKISSSSVNFYDEQLLTACNVKNEPNKIRSLIKNLDVNKIGGGDYIEIKLLSKKEVIKDCLNSIVDKISKNQIKSIEEGLKIEERDLIHDKNEYEKIRNNNFYNNPAIFLRMKDLSDTIRAAEMEINKVKENQGLVIFNAFEIKENVSPKKYIILCFSILIGLFPPILFKLRKFLT